MLRCLPPTASPAARAARRCAPPERVVANTAVRQLLADGGRPLLQRLRQQHSHALSLPLPSGTAGSALPGGLEPLPEGFTSGSSAGGSLAPAVHSPHSGVGSLQPGPALQRQLSVPAQRQEREAAAAAAAVATAPPEQQPHLQPSAGLAQTAAADDGERASGGSLGAGSAASSEHQQPALPAPAVAGAAASAAASAAKAGSSAASSPRPASPQYRHVALGPPVRSGSASSLASPPPSPFESVSSRTFSCTRSGELGPAAAAEGALALPGAPTMPAARPHAAGSGADGLGQPSSQVGSSSLPGTPAALAAAREQGRSAGAAGMPAAAAAAQPAGPPPVRTNGSGAGSDASLAASAAVVAAAAEAAGPGAGPGELEPGASAPMPMHPLCQLHDEVLPLDTASLKSQQLSHGLESLQQAEDAGRWQGPRAGQGWRACRQPWQAARAQASLARQPRAGQGLPD